MRDEKQRLFRVARVFLRCRHRFLDIQRFLQFHGDTIGFAYPLVMTNIAIEHGHL